MGNHACVVFYVPGGTKPDDISPAVYLHWNGGPESVYAFLDEMDRRKVRTNEPARESARFCHIVGDFFDANGAQDGSLAIFPPPATIDAAGMFDLGDGCDNGAYAVYRNGLKRLVRRFIGNKELTSRQVHTERTKAYKDNALDPKRGIPAWFKLARPFLFGEENKFTEKAFSTAIAAWNYGTVDKMAQHLFWSCEWNELPKLADALEEAGFDGVWLLTKLRTPEICGSREDFVRLLAWGGQDNQKK